MIINRTRKVPHPRGAEAAGTGNAVVFGLWGLSLVYTVAAVCLALACTHGQTGASGLLGLNAFDTLRNTPNSGRAPRAWYGERAAQAAKYLEEQVGLLADQYPARVKVSIQKVELKPVDLFGPWMAPECQGIVTEACARTWGEAVLNSTGCATRCPYDLDEPEGPRCCGRTGPGIEHPLTPFASAVLDPSLKMPLPKEPATLTNIVFMVKGVRNESATDDTNRSRSGEDEVESNASDGKAILASAHYDSSLGGPGISNDLAGVAVLLEVARSLASEKPLDRDVIFALVSGSEDALLGSTLFRQSHPWRKRPAVLVNLEGRGKASGKEWLLRANSAYAAEAYARFATRPAGNSISELLWPVLEPGFTDTSLYRRLGYHTMDLVFLEDAYVYHTIDDTISESASPAGLQHEAGNVRSLLRGMAEDYFFPEPLTSEDDPVVGVWNNEYTTDPPLNSGYWYVAFFNTFMVAMPIQVAQVLFVVVAVASPLAALPVLKRQASTAFTTAATSILYLTLGTALSMACAHWVVGSRDLRTWFDWQDIRLIFLGCSGTLPMVLAELLVARPFARQTELGVIAGVLLVNSLLLFLFGLFAPQVCFALLWFSALAPGAGLGTIGAQKSVTRLAAPLVSEVEMNLLSATGARQQPPELQGSQAARRSGEALPRMEEALSTLLARDLVSVCLPTVLSLPMLYALLSSLTFIMDSWGYSWVNGVLCGFSGALLGLPYLAVQRRLSAVGRLLAAGTAFILWAGLLLACLMVPTNTSHHCYYTGRCTA